MGRDISAAVEAPEAAPALKAGCGLEHLSLMYQGVAEYASVLSEFVRNALHAGEPVFAAVPGARARSLADVLGRDAERVVYADMREVGRNPARIIPVIQAFLDRHRGQRVSFVGELTWPGRSGEELAEAARHEALVNIAFAGAPLTMVCPYEAARLPGNVLGDASRTHPLVLMGGRSRASGAYLGPRRLPRGCDQPLPAPPPGARRVVYHDSLREVRTLVARCAAASGLADDRSADLILAVSELAANTLRHTPSGGALWVWRAGGHILCQVEDSGVITDPLAGRVRPLGGEPSGHGLWLVNQICDLVEVRSGGDGTAIRLRMRLGG